MPAIFSRRTDRRVRVTLAALLAMPVVLVAGGMGLVRSDLATGVGRDVPQPVPFDHRIHVRGLRIDCRYCHSGAARTATAGLPPTRSCVPCHTEAWLAAPAFDAVRHSLASGQPIPWNRVHKLPDFVYFNHAAHAVGGVGCESCHGQVDEMARVRQVAPLTMGWCIDCHREPATHRRPRRALTAMRWSGASVPDDTVRPTLACSGCHR